MAIKWLISGYKDEIRPFEVVNETEHFVTVRRKDWHGKSYDSKLKKAGVIFDTFDLAKQHLIAKAKREVINAEANWQRAKQKLKAANDLTIAMPKDD